ncbi:hypothetical protein DSM104299_00821 [Baekduia alba]|uniref:hypothetical protein n=1 Tax=Baekduia alba TaxID=2997333 RepID=UPI002341DB9A|nr:hypothetical protein [Baekduia alba]WCB92136.1 hypothetical protein DSM104299_00821 [Baekduia alba]
MRDSLPHSYDHAWLLAQIVDGYYRTEMASARSDDDPDTRELKLQQAGRARDESRFAREAEQPAEERAHRRRSEKAAYLSDKLAEAERAEKG